jgi:hypothetical protein
MNKQMKHTIWLAIAKTALSLTEYPNPTNISLRDGPSRERTSTLWLCSWPNHLKTRYADVIAD